MPDRKTIDLDREKARPRGNTGDGHTGAPDGEQGISNRPGDADDDEFEDEDDGDDEIEEDDGEGGPNPTA
jgi:hypothetical protein